MDEKRVKVENLARNNEPEAVDEEQLFMSEPIKLEYPLDKYEWKKDSTDFSSFDKASIKNKSLDKCGSPVKLEKKCWNQETQGIDVGSTPDPFQFVDCSHPSKEENRVKIENLSHEEEQFLDQRLKVNYPVESYEWNKDRIGEPDSRDEQHGVPLKQESNSVADVDSSTSEDLDLEQRHLASPAGTHDVEELTGSCVLSGRFIKELSTNLVTHVGNGSDSKRLREIGLQTEGGKPFECDQCNKTFSRKHHLVTHEQSHVGAKPFKCDQCKKDFSRKFTLESHKRLHMGVKPFKCDVCKKAFSRKHHLVAHKRYHTGEKPFQCDQCKKEFSKKEHLVIHERLHTGVKPFECDHCQRTFSQKSTLVTHKLIHTDEKPFKCDECKKTFRRKCDLVIHNRRIHTREEPFECNHCKKTFPLKNRLREHIKIHTGEKPPPYHKQNFEYPFECDVCKKTFARKKYLRKHLRVHKDKSGRV